MKLQYQAEISRLQSQIKALSQEHTGASA